MSRTADALRRPLAGLAVALASVAAATLITAALQPLVQTPATPLFFAAVVVSAWCGGMRPGLLATALSVRTPAVALTADPRMEDRARALEAGCQMHVVVAALARRAESAA